MCAFSLKHLINGLEPLNTKIFHYDHYLKSIPERIRSSSFTPYFKKKLAQKKMISSSVLIPIVQIKKDEWHILLTRRSQHLKHHPGEICFPGGRYEKDDLLLSRTALREYQEETGLESEMLTIVGELPDELTLTGFCITPIVAVNDHLLFSFEQLKINLNEVEEVLSIPLDYLINPIHFTFKEYTFNEGRLKRISKKNKVVIDHDANANEFYSKKESSLIDSQLIKTPVITYKNHTIWGATAKMLWNLNQCYCHNDDIAYD
jgi:8-oxo-dGTP pyrophosphatase MutT (NUDIX family)